MHRHMHTHQVAPLRLWVRGNVLADLKTTQVPNVSAPVNNGTFHLPTWLEMSFWYQDVFANDFPHYFESVFGPVYLVNTMRTSMLNTAMFVTQCCLALFHKRETQESLKGRSQHSVNTERYFFLFLPVCAGFPYSRVLAGWCLRKGGPEGMFQLSSFLGFLWREVLSQISSLCPTESGMNTARWCIFCSWPWGSPF